MYGGFIKLHRKLTEWEWYSDTNTLRLFIHCLLEANWKEIEFKGEIIPKGSFVTTLPKLQQAISQTEQQTRTATKHLISTGNITVKVYSKYRIITVLNYNEYQADNSQSNSQITDKQQETNSQTNTQANSQPFYIKEELKEFKELKDFKDISSCSSMAENFEALDEPKTLAESTSIEKPIHEYFEEEFGRPLSRFEFETIQEFQGWFTSGIILHALKQSVEAGKRSLSYIRGILENWRSSNVKSLEEAIQESENFKKKVQLGKRSQVRQKREDKLPDYYEAEKQGLTVQEDTDVSFDNAEMIELRNKLREQEGKS